MRNEQINKQNVGPSRENLTVHQDDPGEMESLDSLQRNSSLDDEDFDSDFEYIVNDASDYDQDLQNSIRNDDLVITYTISYKIV